MQLGPFYWPAIVKLSAKVCDGNSALSNAWSLPRWCTTQLMRTDPARCSDWWSCVSWIMVHIPVTQINPKPSLRFMVYQCWSMTLSIVYQCFSISQIIFTFSLTNTEAGANGTRQHGFVKPDLVSHIDDNAMSPIQHMTSWRVPMHKQQFPSGRLSESMSIELDNVGTPWARLGIPNLPMQMCVR